MAFRISKMIALRATDYPEFARRVKQSFVKHDGILLRVVHDLDVGAVTMRRWLRADPKLKIFVENVRSRQR